jgi:hypothetical protein
LEIVGPALKSIKKIKKIKLYSIFGPSIFIILRKLKIVGPALKASSFIYMFQEFIERKNYNKLKF